MVIDFPNINRRILNEDNLNYTIKKFEECYPSRNWVLVVPVELKFKAMELLQNSNNLLNLVVSHIIPYDDLWFLASKDDYCLEDGMNSKEYKIFRNMLATKGA